MKYDLKIGLPRDFTAAEKQVMDALLLKAGEVANGVLERIETARRVVMIKDGERVIATGAIKVPGHAYKADVFTKAKCPEAPNNFSIEFGWVVVDEDYKGQRLSSLISDAAMLGFEGWPIYSTSRSTNERMHSSLLRHGLVRTGVEYPSKEHPGENIALFVRATLNQSA